MCVYSITYMTYYMSYAICYMYTQPIYNTCICLRIARNVIYMFAF